MNKVCKVQLIKSADGSNKPSIVFQTAQGKTVPVIINKSAINHVRLPIQPSNTNPKAPSPPTSTCASTSQKQKAPSPPSSAYSSQKAPSPPCVSSKPKETSPSNSSAASKPKKVDNKWSPEQLLELIMAVREHPSIFNPKDDGYQNRVKRFKSWEQVAAQVSLFRTGTTVTESQNKWHSLRTQFAQEQKKIRESKGTDTEAAKVYKPTMKFYEEMLFLKDFLEARRTVDNAGEDDIFEAILREEEVCS
nr:PREDICTED: uncharacterized protein LOC109040506 [Bemisia tabaci]